jgi:hypothetical protein
MAFIRVVLLVLVWTAVSSASVLNADSGRNVVVLHSGDDEMIVRISAELVALGYRPVLIDHPVGELTTSQVRDITSRYRAVALMNATASNEKVAIWVMDPAEGVVFLVETLDAHGKRTDAAMILKSVELLRATLLKTDRMTTPKTHRQRGEEAARRDSARARNAKRKRGASSDSGPTSRRERSIEVPGRVAVELGPSTSYGFSEFPATLQVFLGARVRLTGPLSLGIAGWFPTLPLKVETPDGSAKLWNSAVTVGPRLDVSPDVARWLIWLGASAGPLFSKMKGKGIPPNTDNQDRIAVAVMLLRAGFEAPLGSRARLHAALHLGWGVPRPVVRVGEFRVPWGNPLLGGVLGLSVTLF